MFGTLKLSMTVDILTFLGSATVWATISKIFGNFSQKLGDFFQSTETCIINQIMAIINYVAKLASVFV